MRYDDVNARQRAMAKPPYELEFYADPETGDQPVLRWFLEELSPVLCRLLGAAMDAILQVDGIGVCDGEFGKHLRGGLFEFRVNGNPQAIIDEERRRRGKKPKKIDPPSRTGTITPSWRCGSNCYVPWARRWFRRWSG